MNNEGPSEKLLSPCMRILIQSLINEGGDTPHNCAADIFQTREYARVRRTAPESMEVTVVSG